MMSQFNPDSGCQVESGERRGDGHADGERPGQGGFRPLTRRAELAGEDLEECIEEAGGDRIERVKAEVAHSRPGDDQHREEAHEYSDPGRQSHFFAEQRLRQSDDEERGPYRE